MLLKMSQTWATSCVTHGNPLVGRTNLTLHLDPCPLLPCHQAPTLCPALGSLCSSLSCPAQFLLANGPSAPSTWIVHPPNQRGALLRFHSAVPSEASLTPPPPTLTCCTLQHLAFPMPHLFMHFFAHLPFGAGDSAS